MRTILCLICCMATVFLSFSASAAKQKYTRRYQKKNVYVQQKTPYIQEKDLPNAAAYIEVSRKNPQVTVEHQSQETSFKVDPENRVSCGGKEAFSCTHFAVNFFTTTDCETSRITLKVTETQKMSVVLSSLYAKGTCQFDRILKHELSHVNTYRKTLSAFLEQAKQDLTEEYKTMREKSKGCKDVQKSINDLTEKLNRQYSEKVRTANAKLDMENGTHKYGFENCERQEEKESLK